MKYTLSYFRPYIGLIILTIAVLFGQVMCELALPGYMSDIINKGIVARSMSKIYFYGYLMIAVAFGSVAFAICSSLIASRVSAASSRDIRSALFRKVTSFSSSEFDQFSTASLITRSTNDVQMIQQASVMIIRLAFFAPIMGVGALIKAVHTNVSLTWTIGIALVGILVLMLTLFFMVMPKFKVLQSKLDRLNLIVGERLSGLLVVRAFNSEKSEEKRYDDANMELTKINIFVNRAMSFMFPALMIIMNLTSVLIVWVGAKMTENGSLMIGDMLAFLQYAMQIIMAFLIITMMFIMIPRAAVSAKRIGDVLKVEPSITDDDSPEIDISGDGTVEFRNVSFAYPDAAENTLSNISFTAKHGQTTAIIGGTGSGKSSLISLIPRFFDTSEGEVLINGHDVRKVPQEKLRDMIGYVPQKGLLFSGTIGSNLRYGKEDASPEDMRSAASTAQALDFIESLPEGFDTIVSQGGTTVSGGQKQRLSIARALIKDPQVYIFDDSFSALDFKTDAALRSALKRDVSSGTFIIVAQRINTIMDADNIIVLDEGHIVGQGTHEQLLNNCDIYKEIAYSQLSEKELEGREN